MSVILAILGLVFYLPLAVILELTKRYTGPTTADTLHS